MPPINVMVNGLPGQMARTIAGHIIRNNRFRLLPWSLTGPEITDAEISLESLRIELLRPERRQKSITPIIADAGGRIVCIDFTHPTAVNDNAAFYCRNRLPFVMGTTGGNRAQLFETVQQSPICAVIAPNMAKQIVGLQAMFEYAAANFPGLFADFKMTVRESHQQGKADTSGTAKAIVACCRKLGLDFDPADICKERDPQIQRHQWRIPEAYIDGHGWHTYSFESPDKTALFEITHNINGREIYIQGTLDAIDFLLRQIDQGMHGRVFTMIDVIKG